MPTVLTSSQQTFVDITDQRKLSAYITSNLPKTQSEDPNVLPHTYAPSWASTHLVLTPVVFLDQTSIALGSNSLTITWKRKDGTSAETAVTSGESVSGGILTVSQNKLSASTSGMITYICYISYYDSETKNTVNISSDITFTLVKNAENAKLAYVTADTYVFKYDTSGALVGATQATLTGQVQGVTISKWQYKNSSGNWADYPTTSDNTSITGGTLVVKPAHAVFVNNVAQIKLVTSDADVYDTVTITKIYDGTKGDPGTPGSSGSGGLSVILSNEAQSIPCTSGGAVTAATNVTIPFTAYEGIEQKAATCTVGTLPSGVTVKSNTPATATAAGSVVLTFAKNATLGGASVLTGTIPLTFSVSGKSVTKNFAWTKANAGTSGTSAVVFSVYAPNGTIVQNQSGSCDCNHERNLSVGKIQQRQLDQYLRGHSGNADSAGRGYCEYPVLPVHHDLQQQELRGRHYGGRQVRSLCVGNALHRRLHREEQSRWSCALCDCSHESERSRPAEGQHLGDGTGQSCSRRFLVPDRSHRPYGYADEIQRLGMGGGNRNPGADLYLVCAGQGWQSHHLRQDREGYLSLRRGHRFHPDPAV